MRKTSIVMDDKTRKTIDDYCIETGKQLSVAIREFIKKGLDLHAKKKAVGHQDAVGPNGLMLNQKYALRASIEGTLILRELAKSILNDEHVLDEIDAEVSKIMTPGWHYDNKS